MSKFTKVLIALLVILIIVMTAFTCWMYFKPEDSTSSSVDETEETQTENTEKAEETEETGDETEESTSELLEDPDFQARVSAYMEANPDLDQEEAEKRVAMNLDEEPYEDVTVMEFADSVTLLVNKYNKLPDGYAPEDLTEVPSSGEHGTVYMRQEAAEAFINLVNAAAEQGMVLNACSTYRSESDQDTLWTNGVANYGIEYADAYWTRPGHSEHQTGLCVDIRLNNDLSDLDAVTYYPEDYQWLLDNMADYGFVIRYGTDKEEYTLIAPESWHLRYVGTELAQYLTENNLSLDEYYGLLALGRVEDLTRN